MPGLSAGAHTAEAAVDPRLKPRGSSQGGLRQYNERVVLQALRMHGALPAAEIARYTGLTAQAVSLISKRLLDDGLLRKGEPQRGRVGQPSVPLHLNADGALAIGIEVGRRSLDMLLVDFNGSARRRWTLQYRHADPALLLAEIGARLKEITRGLAPAQRARLQGVGIAAPLSMGGWQQLLGVPEPIASRWQGLDLRAEVARLTRLPVMLIKDTAAACVAELLVGQGRSLPSFVYAYIDTFVGGALVLDSQLRAGAGGNAGALGSMPLWLARDAAQGPPAQLLSVASLLALEQLYGGAGLDAGATTDARALAAPWRAFTERWLEQCAPALAQALTSAACVLDIDSVVIDGSIDRGLLSLLIDRTEAALGFYNLEGIRAPRLRAGNVGPDARAIGGALLPLHAQFSPDRELFLKAAQ
jgi:predicted NBD/HSP70 family sugar kinase